MYYIVRKYKLRISFNLSVQVIFHTWIINIHHSNTKRQDTKLIILLLTSCEAISIQSIEKLPAFTVAIVSI